MSKKSAPRRGSLSFAKRITHKLIPSTKNYSLESFYGIKVAMDHVNFKGRFTPVTILQIPQHNIVKNIETEAGTRTIIAVDFKSVPCNMNKIIYKQVRYIPQTDSADEKEIPCVKQLKGSLNITGVTKAKGFQGVVKRYNLKLKKRKHTRASKTRHIGCVSPRTPSWVTWNSAQCGRTGQTRRTYRNCMIVPYEFKTQYPQYGKINVEKCIAIKGSIPGPSKRVILCQYAANN